MRHRQGRRRVPPVIKFFITVIMLGLMSYGAAFLWQNAEDKFIAAQEAESRAEKLAAAQEREAAVNQAKAEVQESIPEPSSPYMAANSTSQINVGGIKTASEAAQDSQINTGGNEADSDDATVPEPAYAREPVAGAVPPSAAVDYGYFSDAIFFGDSISTGIPLYMKTLVPNAAVIAQKGVSPDGALTSQCIDVDGTRVTMLEAAKTKGDRSKIYIMLGANALDLDETAFINGYADFVKAVKEMYPDTIIYVQSILPVTSGVNKTYPSPNINNQRISDYNDAIRTMAMGQGVHYVDVAQCMVGSDGMLPTDASPLDGMHLTPEYYIKWFDYLRTHTTAAPTKTTKKVA